MNKEIIVKINEEKFKYNALVKDDVVTYSEETAKVSFSFNNLTLIRKDLEHTTFIDFKAKKAYLEILGKRLDLIIKINIINLKEDYVKINYDINGNNFQYEIDMR